MSSDDIVFQSNIGEAIYKIIVIGDPTVGKTSLLTRFASKQFKTQYLPTVGVNIVKEVVDLSINEGAVKVSLMFWDIAGQKFDESLAN